MDEGTLNLESMDIAEEKRRELLRLFPEAATEGGKIDFDQLKRALGDTVDAGRERYGMNWPGKADCFRLIQSPSTATLLPVRDESVRFDETENMIIEGDNLEVLKLLQKGYQGKVKMIYIDPPYNTGNDFIYPDDFADNLKNYLQYTGQVDAEGKKFSNNVETDGRFHSNWLNMMYPRLYLAKNLLREDGVIFISCDDHELAGLRAVCDLVFGENNFITTIIWQKVYAPKSSARHFSYDHDYIVVYARVAESWFPRMMPRTSEQDEDYRNIDDDPRGPWKANNLSARNFYSKGTYSIRTPGGRLIDGPPRGRYWAISEEKLWALHAEGGVWWGKGGNNVPAPKIYFSAVKEGRVPQTLWKYEQVGHTQEAKKDLVDLLSFQDSDSVFDTPKPARLLKRILQISTSTTEPDIVVDFFAGSGTFAQAVIEQNSEDGGKRSAILVQLPEPTGRDDYRTIADITKERVRQVIQRQETEAGERLDLQHDGTVRRKEGFRVFKLAPSNFKVWEAHTDEGVEGVQRQMELAVHHILPDRTAEDLFFEILMKSEYPLTAKVEHFDAAGVAAYSVQDDELIICVERVVTEEAVNAIVKRKPSKVIFLDEAFSGNDQLKANAKMNFDDAGVKRFETV